MSKRTPPKKSSPASSSAAASAALPDAAAIIAALHDAGVPLAPDDLAQRLGVDDARSVALAASVAELERDGRVLVNRKGEVCIVAKLDLVTARSSGIPTATVFSFPTKAATTCSSVRAKCTRCCTVTG